MRKVAAFKERKTAHSVPNQLNTALPRVTQPPQHEMSMPEVAAPPQPRTWDHPARPTSQPGKDHAPVCETSSAVQDPLPQ